MEVYKNKSPHDLMQNKQPLVHMGFYCKDLYTLFPLQKSQTRLENRIFGLLHSPDE